MNLMKMDRTDSMMKRLGDHFCPLERCRSLTQEEIEQEEEDPKDVEDGSVTWKLHTWHDWRVWLALTN